MTGPAEEAARLGFALLRERRFQEGLALLVEAHRLDPARSDVLLVLGHMRQLGGQVAEAKPFFLEAVTVEPERPFGHAKLGRIAGWLGHWDEALAHYRAAVDAAVMPPPPCFVEQGIESAESTSVSAYSWMIQILAENDRFAEMAVVIGEATTRHPGAPSIHRQAFEGWLTAGEPGRAADSLRTMTRCRLDPGALAEVARYSRLCTWMEESRRQAVPAVAGKFRRDARSPLVIAIAVWGDGYVRGFLDYYLRSMAAPGNLPALAAHFDVRFAVVTTAGGREQIQASPVARRLDGIVAFDYFLIPGDLIARSGHEDDSKFVYRLYTMAMHVGVAYAQAIGAAISFSIPDGIIADGSFGNLARLVAEKNPDGVFAQGLTVAERGLLGAIDDFGIPLEEPLAVPPRDLMALGARHLHPFLEQRIVCPASQDFSSIRSAAFWWERDGLVGHIFHWHPIYVSAERLQRYRAFRYVSIDGTLPQFLFPDPADWRGIHLVVESDEFSFLGTIQEERRVPSSGHPFSVEDFASYYRHSEQVRDISRWMFRHRVKYVGFVPPGLDPGQMTYNPALITAICGEPPVLGVAGDGASCSGGVAAQPQGG
jgi:hypothetical protein